MDKSPEAVAIIAKLKKRGAQPDDEAAEDEGSADTEAKRAAAEDLFQAIRGRAPSDAEAAAVEDALTAFCEAQGY